MTLAKAREVAREWLALKERGLNPKVEAKRHQWAEQARRAVTFAVVAEDFVTPAT